MTLKNHTLKILTKYILTMIIIYIKMDLKKQSVLVGIFIDNDYQCHNIYWQPCTMVICDKKF